jgi:hypothetical protein
LKIGTIQGSVLSPLLFSIYINDIFKIILNGILFLFADDITLVIKAKSYSNLQQKIDSDMNELNEWLTENKLILNSEKSCFMVMGEPEKGRKSKSSFGHKDLKVVISNKNLKRVEEIKILGIKIDNALSFGPHIKALAKQVSNRTSFLYRLKQFLPIHTLNLVFKALIQPNLDYGNVIWGMTYESHLKRLIVQQKRAAKIITNSKWFTNCDPLFKQLQWLPLMDKIRFSSIKYIYKAINGLNANLSKKFFEFRTSRSSRRTTDDLTLKLPQIKCNFVKNTIFYSGSQYWNDCP